MGYITAVETLKIVTETSITNTVQGSLDEKYNFLAPESMHETFMSDSEDEGGEDQIDQHQYKYMVTDDLKGGNLMADTNKFDTNDDDGVSGGPGGFSADRKVINETNVSSYVNQDLNSNPFIIKATDNIHIVRQPIHVG